MALTFEQDQDFEKASQFLDDVEVFEVNYHLLKETKIGKVVRKIASLEFEKDEHNIIERCKDVLTKWKATLPGSGDEEAKTEDVKETKEAVEEDDDKTLQNKSDPAEPQESAPIETPPTPSKGEEQRSETLPHTIEAAHTPLVEQAI